MYLLTTYYRGAPNIDNMRLFADIDKAYAHWKRIRIEQSLTYSPWWEQSHRSCRAWLLSEKGPPKLVSKLFEEMVKRDYNTK
jgi:hypothetical protein